MSVVVGYVPTREGEAALEHAMREARSRGDPAGGGEHLARRRAGRPAVRRRRPARARSRSSSRSRASSTSVVHTIRGRDASEEILAVGRGAPGGAGRHRAAPPLPGRQAAAWASTAQRVLLDAPCPVLAVKAPTS